MIVDDNFWWMETSTNISVSLKIKQLNFQISSQMDKRLVCFWEVCSIQEFLFIWSESDVYKHLYKHRNVKFKINKNYV